MRFRKLFVFIALLAVLAAATVFKKISADKEKRAADQTAVALERVTPVVEPASVNDIRLRQGEEVQPLQLEKKEDGRWMVKSRFGAKARTAAVESLVKSVSGVKGELRSGSKDLLGDYRLLEQEAIRIELMNAEAKPLLDVLVSPERASSRRNFARLAGSDSVFAVHSDVLSALGLYAKDSKIDAKSFMDLRLFPVQSSEVTKIGIVQKGQPLVLVRGEAPAGTPSWTFEPASKGDEIDPAKVSGLLTGLSNLHGRDVLDPAGDHAFGPQPWIRLTEKKGDTISQIDFYLGRADAEKKTTAIRVVPDNLVYEVDSSGIDGLKTDRASFLTKAAK